MLEIAELILVYLSALASRDQPALGWL